MQNLIAAYGRLIEKTNCDYLRYMHKTIAWQERLIAIKGARGTGKTTLLLQHIKMSFPDRDKAFYASLDNVWFATHTLLELIDYLYTHGVSHVFLDEVHRYPTWVKEIKNAYDSYPDLHIVFTGSSLLKIDGAKADLSRRLRIYHMNGLSFREYLGMKGIGSFNTVTLNDIITNHLKIASSITSKIKVLPLFEEYLEQGYYPFFVEVSDAGSYRERVQQMLSTAIYEDIPSVEDITYETLLKTQRLVATLAQTVPFMPNISTLCATLSCARNQVLRLMGLLDRADLLRLLLSDNKKLKAVGKPDKILFNNTNLMSALVDTPDTGTIRESFLASMLCESHTLSYPVTGDILVDRQFLFEIGGRNKDFSQIRNIKDSFIAADEIETGFGNKIPLWLFGMLY